ncbi:DNA alkylation repair protein [Meiothermus sp.]|uniref:DNA alkylation repair protein n=1 Tax=Meiothermus sp. TaxID=1955249 RepID=UPI00307E2E6C
MGPGEFVAQVKELLQSHQNPAQAAPMARYMKNLFPFLGLKRPERDLLTRQLLAQVKGSDEAWLLEATLGLWKLPEREFQYVATDLLWMSRKALTPATLPFAEQLMVEKSWWDSVDALTGQVVGPLVWRFPELKKEMDRCSRHPNFWMRRCAIIHQLAYKDKTDPERLFRYCLDNAADPEFFIRKAIGWALRQYARTNPQAVYTFVDNHRDRLSPLSIREALKHRQ